MASLDGKLAVDVDEVQALGGPGRTVVYSEIRAGRLKARKCGRRTLILVDDLREYLFDLPTVRDAG
jgi:hypothetical protein